MLLRGIIFSSYFFPRALISISPPEGRLKGKKYISLVLEGGTFEVEGSLAEAVLARLADLVWENSFGDFSGLDAAVWIMSLSFSTFSAF